jgi:hypothetical protein
MRGWLGMAIVIAASMVLPAEAGQRHWARPQVSVGYNFGHPLGFYGPYYSPWYYGPRFGVGIYVGDRYPVRRVRSERVDAREQRALKLYVYPAAGQSESQTAEDRYQCHVWAADRSGHDPTLGAGRRSRLAWRVATMSSNRTVLTVAAVAFVAGTALAAEDLGALEVVGQRGQSLDQVRRDRYECHNWAVEQTGASPARVASGSERDEPSVRRERVDRAIAGAAIGAGVGGLLGGGRRRDAADRVLGGAAVGAALGAATARGRDHDDDAAEAPSDYLRALAACLEGRGYSVRMPTKADFAANGSH